MDVRLFRFYPDQSRAIILNLDLDCADFICLPAPPSYLYLLWVPTWTFGAVRAT